jgi:hypothetical protein
VVTLHSGTHLDGRTGRPVWLIPREQGSEANAVLLDPGGPARQPRYVAHPPGLTICRSALATTPDGIPAPLAGDPVLPGRADGDPRWTRPLPWTNLILFTIGLNGFLAFAGLALINLAVPLVLLWLAARRRPWTLRLLMVLPVAAAIPLAVFQAIEPLLPAEIASRPVSGRTVFVLATLAGVPLATCVAAVVSNVARLRLRRLAVLVALTLATSAIAAAGWVWFDRRTMPAIEHYGRSGWPLAVLLGAYSTGILIVLIWPVRRLYRWLKRPRRIADGAA